MSERVQERKNINLSAQPERKKTSEQAAVNRQSVADKFKTYLRHPGSMITMLLVMLAAIITFAVLIFLIAYVLVNGVPYIKPSLFSLHYTSENASVVPALVNTIVMTLLSLLIAVPFGIFSAIFLVEYAGRGNKFVNVIRLTTETLSGIPSIVYGLFGMLFFVNTLHWGFSILAGAFTLSIMILPLTGSRKTSYGIPHCTSNSSTWNSGRCHSFHRTYRRRDSSTDLYSRYSSADSEECIRIRTYIGSSYVQSFK